MVEYPCAEDSDDRLLVDEDIFGTEKVMRFDCLDEHGNAQTALLDRDAVSALIGQLTSFLERTRRTDGKIV